MGLCQRPDMATAERLPLRHGDVEEAGIRASPPPMPLLHRLTATLLGDGKAEPAEPIEEPPTAPSWGVTSSPEPSKGEPIEEPPTAPSWGVTSPKGEPIEESPTAPSWGVTSSSPPLPSEPPVSASAPVPVPSHRRSVSVSPPQSCDSMDELAEELSKMYDSEDAAVGCSSMGADGGSSKEEDLEFHGAIDDDVPGLILDPSDDAPEVGFTSIESPKLAVSEAAWFGRGKQPILVTHTAAAAAAAAAAVDFSDDDTGLGPDDEAARYDIFTGELKPVFRLEERVQKIEDRVEYLERRRKSVEASSSESDNDDSDHRPAVGSSLVSLM